MGGFSNAPRCPAFLTFRDSPALSRQESDGYPVRPVASTPTPTAHSPLLVPPSNSPDPDKPPDVGPLPRTPPPLLPLAHTPARHAHTRQTRRPALKRKRKKGMRRPAGETPRLCKPQRGAAIAEAVPKHNSKTRSGPGGLGGSPPDRCCTAGAEHQKMSVVGRLGCRPCFPSLRQSGTYAAPGRGRARSSTEPRAPNDPGGE